MTDSPAPRGFARLTPEQRSELARQGGRAAQKSGKAHRWTSDTGKAAAKLPRKRRADRDVAG